MCSAPAGPAAATASIGDSANWGECHLRLERVAPYRCLATRMTEAATKPAGTIATLVHAGYDPAVDIKIPQRYAVVPTTRGSRELERGDPEF